MSSVKQYTLPTYNQGLRVVEQTRNELVQKFRQGQKLDYEEQDWLDWAENALMRSSSR